jgi:hypothetical protein
MHGARSDVFCQSLECDHGGLTRCSQRAEMSPDPVAATLHELVHSAVTNGKFKHILAKVTHACPTRPDSYLIFRVPRPRAFARLD